MRRTLGKAAGAVVWLGLVVGCAKPVDLLPTLSSSNNGNDLAAFCRRDARGRLIVRVENRGQKVSPATTTTVQVAGYPPFVLPTRPILPRNSTDVSLPLPDECDLRCSFTIVVDARNEVLESDEDNNRINGACSRLAD